MGLIITAIIGVIIIGIKALSNYQEIKEEDRHMKFLAESRHHFTEISKISRIEFECRNELISIQLQYSDKKITHEEYLLKMKLVADKRLQLLNTFDVTEEEIYKYYAFYYLDKDGKSFLRKEI